MRRLGVLLGLVALLAVGGCAPAACKSGTLLVEVTLSGAPAGATSLAIDVTVPDGGERTSTVQLAGRHGGSIEVDFSRYPAGKKVTVVVTAQKDGVVLGTQSGALTLGHDCGYLALSIDKAVVDVPPAGGDMAMHDGCAPVSCSASQCGVVDGGCGQPLDCGACALWAVSPTIAVGGDTLTLEGKFGSDATVRFPGGVTAPATLVGAGRATVNVPAAAGTGPLQVATGVTTSYDSGAYGRATPAPRLDRAGFATVRTPSWIYLIGGIQANDADFAADKIERASANGDDTLNPFDFQYNPPDSDGEAEAMSLVESRGYVASAVLGNHVYIIGGFDVNRGKELASIEESTIQSDGSLGPFSIASTTLTTAREGASAIVVGNTLYVIGGDGARNPPMPLSSIEAAPIRADGTLGPFTTVTNSALISPRSQAAVFVTPTSVYVMGGRSTTFLGSIERATISPDGSLGPFTLVTDSALSVARAGAALVATSNGVALVGGRSGDDATLKTVEQATVKADGTLTPFGLVGTSGLTSGRSDAGAVVVGNWVYVLGGFRPFDTTGFRLERASIDASGQLAPFTVDKTTSAAMYRTGACSVVVGNQLYVMGGRDVRGLEIDSVEVATIAPDGSLSPFTLTDSFTAVPQYDGNGNPIPGKFVELAVPRSKFSLFVLDGAVYVAGGFQYSGTTAGSQSSVEVAGFTGLDWNLGPFQAAPPLQTARNGHDNLVLGQTVYVLGGASDFNAAPVESATSSGYELISNFSVSDIMLGNVTSFSHLVIGNQLYLLGDAYEIDTALLGGATPIGGFTASAATLARRTNGVSISYVLGNHAYVIGGGSADVQSTVLP
jgi:hypothetical protein